MKKQEKLKVKLSWVEDINMTRKSCSCVTVHGQLIVTEMEDKIFIQGCGEEDGSLKTSVFLLYKDAALILSDLLKKILDEEKENK